MPLGHRAKQDLGDPVAAAEAVQLAVAPAREDRGEAWGLAAVKERLASVQPRSPMNVGS